MPKLAFPHCQPPADQRADRPASDAPPRKGRPAAFAADPFILDDALGRKIDDGEIGVVAHGDAAFAGNAEDTLRTCAGQIDEAGKTQASGIDVIEHHRHERLHARHARGRRRIALALLLERVRRVIGAEHIDHALAEAPPQPLPVVTIAERRVHLRARAENFVSLGRGERQMLRRHLDRGNVLMQREQRHLLARGDMQHMHPLACGGGDPQQPLGRSERRADIAPFAVARRIAFAL